MTRDLVPLSIPDLSAFARTLSGQMATRPAPSHLELLNMLARAGGFRNFQHLRAARAAERRLDAPASEGNAADLVAVERALRRFDAQGRLADWPSRRGQQALCLWALWSAFPSGVDLREAEVNALLGRLHGFGDPALLRRDMLGLGLLTRDAGCLAYRRQEIAPPAEARALIRHISLRQRQAPVR